MLLVMVKCRGLLGLLNILVVVFCLLLFFEMFMNLHMNCIVFV